MPKLVNLFVHHDITHIVLEYFRFKPFIVISFFYSNRLSLTHLLLKMSNIILLNFLLVSEISNNLEFIIEILSQETFYMIHKLKKEWLLILGLLKLILSLKLFLLKNLKKWNKKISKAFLSSNKLSEFTEDWATVLRSLDATKLGRKLTCLWSQSFITLINPTNQTSGQLESYYCNLSLENITFSTMSEW